MYIGTYALYFDPAFKSAKTKLVKYKNGSFMTNVCPVVCVGPAAVKKFLWTVGAGELTGSGFGAMSVGSLPATRPINQRPSSSQFIHD
jgi:hypothetical protein